MSEYDLNINYANATPPQKNLSMLGRNFDLTTLDPMDLSGSALMNNFVQYHFNKNYHPVPDNSMTVPDGVLYKPGSGGNFSSLTKKTSTYKEFIVDIAQTIKFGISDPLGINAFSSSVSVKYYNQEAQEQRTELTDSRLVVYDDTLKIDYLPKLDRKGNITNNSAASAAVNPVAHNELMSITNESTATDFIEAYGTHYSTLVQFGGIAYQWIFFTEQKRAELEKFGVDISVEAKGALQGIVVSAESDSSAEYQNKFRSVTLCDRQFVNFVGGLPSENLYAWASTVHSDPAPIAIGLTPITGVFNDRNCIQCRSLETAVRQKYGR